MIALGPVLAAMLSLPQFIGDRSDSDDERDALYQPIAYEISMVARTPSEGALLVAVAFHESGFARYVIEGRCKDGPVGARCDNGKARGIFQLHAATCPAAYAERAGSRSSLSAETACALRLLRWGGQQCRSHSLTPTLGAIGVYAGQGCHWSGAEKRVRTEVALLQKWGRS